MFLTTKPSLRSWSQVFYRSSDQEQGAEVLSVLSIDGLVFEKDLSPDVLVCALNPSTREAESRGSL